MNSSLVEKGQEVLIAKVIVTVDPLYLWPLMERPLLFTMTTLGAPKHTVAERRSIPLIFV